MVDWDACAQAEILLEAVGQLEAVLDRGDERMEESTRDVLVSMRETADKARRIGTGELVVPDDAVELLRADAYQCIRATEELAEEFAWLLDRVPGLRRGSGGSGP